jgi:hypothetical protein
MKSYYINQQMHLIYQIQFVTSTKFLHVSAQSSGSFITKEKPKTLIYVLHCPY